MVSRIRRRRGLRRGLRRRPEGGWPLDELLVGPATVGILRELLDSNAWGADGRVRAWDLAVSSGVSPQGAANALERLRRLGLLVQATPARDGRAPTYRLDRGHPLWAPLARLFGAELAMVRSTLQPLGGRREG